MLLLQNHLGFFHLCYLWDTIHVIGSSRISCFGQKHKPGPTVCLNHKSIHRLHVKILLILFVPVWKTYFAFFSIHILLSFSRKYMFTFFVIHTPDNISIDSFMFFYNLHHILSPMNNLRFQSNKFNNWSTSGLFFHFTCNIFMYFVRKLEFSEYSLKHIFTCIKIFIT